MNENSLFHFWMIGLVFALGLQIIGNYIHEMENTGIIIAIFYVFCLLMDARRIK